VDKINIPSLVIHAQEDPICPVYFVPEEQLKQNKKVVYLLTKKGSHVCYFEDIGRP
jgi:predicted alpha/beta-fold hydrolase